MAKRDIFGKVDVDGIKVPTYWQCYSDTDGDEKVTSIVIDFTRKAIASKDKSMSEKIRLIESLVSDLVKNLSSDTGFFDGEPISAVEWFVGNIAEKIGLDKRFARELVDELYYKL